MDITINRKLPEVFGVPPYRDLLDVNEIVIHHTAGDGNWKGLLSWFLKAEGARKELYQKAVALTHYYIEKDGNVIEAYPLTTWLYHSCSGKRDKFTIGIELIHKEGKFTDKQYAALCGLIFDYLPEKCPNIKTISSHDYRYLKYSGRSKGCPGKDFDWSIIKDNNRFGWEVNA
jgi:N-acetyl-anhydromuramyl-L-alanine amidase AmpD